MVDEIQPENNKKRNLAKSGVMNLWNRWKSKNNSEKIKALIQSTVAATVAGGLAVGAIGYVRANDAQGTIRANESAWLQDLQGAQQAAVEAQTKADAAQETANSVNAKAEEAQSVAAQAQSKADAAASKAETAQNAASQTQEAAKTAQKNAETAQNVASQAQAVASDAKTEADKAVQNATVAQSVADKAQTDADKVANDLEATDEQVAQSQAAADVAKQKADEAKTIADGAVAKAATAQVTADGAIETADELATVLDGMIDRVVFLEDAAVVAQEAADQAQLTADNALAIAQQALADAATAQAAADEAKAAAEAAQATASEALTKVNMALEAGPRFILFPNLTFNDTMGEVMTDQIGTFHIDEGLYIVEAGYNFTGPGNSVANVRRSDGQQQIAFSGGVGYRFGKGLWDIPPGGLDVTFFVDGNAGATFITFNQPYILLIKQLN